MEDRIHGCALTGKFIKKAILTIIELKTRKGGNP